VGCRSLYVTGSDYSLPQFSLLIGGPTAASFPGTFRLPFFLRTLLVATTRCELGIITNSATGNAIFVRGPVFATQNSGNRRGADDGVIWQFRQARWAFNAAADRTGAIWEN